VFSDPDVIKVGGWSIRNAEAEDHTLLSVAEILQYSSNGMVQVMQESSQQTTTAGWNGWG